MQAVITSKQAKQITGGRTPLVPVEYERACQALAQCVTIDEAKYWSDKADALAAWAKIYRDDQTGRKAAALKLHAYRRMGQLAAELRPKKAKYGGGLLPGPRSLLRENGLSQSHAIAARTLARMDKEPFDALIARPKIPTPTGVRLNPANSELATWLQSAHSFRTHCRAVNAKEITTLVEKDRLGTVGALVTEILEWLDEFEQHLPKEK